MEMSDGQEEASIFSLVCLSQRSRRPAEGAVSSLTDQETHLLTFSLPSRPPHRAKVFRGKKILGEYDVKVEQVGVGFSLALIFMRIHNTHMTF